MYETIMTQYLLEEAEAGKDRGLGVAVPPHLSLWLLFGTNNALCPICCLREFSRRFVAMFDCRLYAFQIDSSK